MNTEYNLNIEHNLTIEVCLLLLKAHGQEYPGQDLSCRQSAGMPLVHQDPFRAARVQLKMLKIKDLTVTILVCLWVVLLQTRIFMIS